MILHRELPYFVEIMHAPEILPQVLPTSHVLQLKDIPYVSRKGYFLLKQQYSLPFLVSSGSRTPSKSKSPRDGKEKGRTEKKYSVEEEEGEILSDISDNEQKDKVERRLAEESTHVNQPREKGEDIKCCTF